MATQHCHTRSNVFSEFFELDGSLERQQARRLFDV
jgi:hypothetical protein